MPSECALKGILHEIFDFTNKLHSIEDISNFYKDIHNFVFTAGVFDTSGKLFTDVTHDDILSPVSLLPAINYRRCN
jgi:hypothetical protein